MSGRVNLLSALLALQLVIIAAVLLVETGFGESEQGPFLSFEADEVDELRITGDGDDPTTLVLSRSEDGWHLPDGLPADANKVRDVLDRLEGLRAPWPVATSGGAAERFEVTSDNFQRHVVLTAGGDTVADLYLGTSPGYQQVHARRADDSAVYSVGISNYQVPVAVDDWLDKTLLQPQGAITAVERPGVWRLTRAEEGWQLGDAAADQEAARELVRRLSELRVTGVAEAPGEGTEPSARLVVTDEAGSYQLALFAGGEGNPYQVRSDRRDGVFSLAVYLAEQILVERGALVAGEKPSGPSDDAAPAGEAPANGAPAPGEEGEPAPENAAEPGT